MRRGNSILLLLLLAFVACTEDMTTNNGTVNDERIRFTVSVADDQLAVTRALGGHSCEVTVTDMESDYPQPLFLHTVTSPWTTATDAQTRSTMINNLSQVTSFGVSGYRYNPATETLDSKPANFFYNAEAVEKFTDSWETSKAYYLPAASERLAFYAYLPYGGTDLTLAPEATTGPMTISYKVDLSKSDQDDLMTAASATPLEYSKTEVPLTFHHALTAVSIELGDNVAAGKIQKIYFDNIAYEGNYRVGKGWTSLSYDTDTLFFTTDGGLDTAPEKVIVADNDAIFMIPQTFTSDDQRINVILSDDEGTYRLRKSLKGSTWREGTVVKYTVTTSSINFAYVGSVKYPVRWGATAFSLRSGYTAGESIGVFTVDKTNGKVQEANVEYKLDASGKWKSGSERLHFDADRLYYAYYPYRATLTGGPAVGDAASDTDAATFFQGAIQSWSITTDQSTEAKLLANDMQISKATDSSVSTLQFEMQHAMGLAEITLGEKTFTGDIEYYLSTDANYRWTGIATETIRASEKLANNMKAYKNSSTLYYYITRAGEATTFTCGVSNVANAWATTSKTLTIASGARDGFTAEVSNNTTLPAEKEWELQVGDVFFNDGSLASSATNYPSATYPNRKAVGLVLSTETSETDRNTNGFTHGYVICAQQRRADTWSLSGYSNGTYTGRLASSYYVAGSGRTAQQNLLKFFIENLDGYRDCQTVMKNAGYKANPDNFRAVNYANQYNSTLPVTTPSGNCSGWYLPSSGQLYLYVQNFGGIPSTALGSPQFHSTYGFRWNGYTNTAVSNFNNAYSSRGFKTSNSSNIYTSVAAGYTATLYTSTEIDAYYVYNLCPWTDNACYFDANDPKYDTGQQFCVRPVLAF